jgi:hypothetical protein
VFGWSAHRRIFQPSVDSVGVVVVDIFAEKTLQVFLIHDDHMIEKLATGSADPSLGNPISPRASKGRPSRRNSDALDRFGDPFGENRIVVVDEESWRGVIWECFAEMLYDPR